ncbi:MAG: Ig-like domain-containing protein, partial [Balneolaceae bacterium]|nr:Ig-like domain-containing protein [Balneolaceae bacterium]
MIVNRSNFHLLILTVLLFIPGISKGQDEPLSEQEQIKLQQVRDSLIQRGFLQDSQESTQTVEPQAASTALLLYDAWYTEKRLNVKTVSSRSTDFRPDGRRFYILGRDQETIAEYHLDDPWQINTAEFIREFSTTKELDATDQGSASHGLFFRKSDGERMWMLNRTEIWEYTLSTPWDVTSATQTGYKDLSDVVVRGHDIDFKPDGSVLYVDDRILEVVHQFELSSDWEVETASLDYAFDISDQQQAVRGTQFSPDGEKMFLMDTGRQEVLEYNVSTPFDLRSASYKGAFSVASESVSPEGLTFKPDLSAFYVTANLENYVHQYKISTIDSGESTVSANKGKIIADGSAEGRITVVARDNDGDRIIGREISLSSNSSSADIDEVNSKTNSDGEAYFDVSNSEEESVTFTAKGPDDTIDDKATILFVSVNKDESSVESNDEKVIADGDAKGEIVVTARDVEGDPLSDVMITLNANSSDVNVDDETKQTNNDGEVVFSVSNNTAETVTFSAEGMGNTIEETASIKFVTIDAGESSVVSEDNKVIANGKQAGRVIVTAKDSDGDLLEGVSIKLNSDSDTAEIESVNSKTNSEGIARFDVTNTAIETVEFEAEGLGVEINQQASIRFAGVNAGESSVESSNEKVLANGEANSTITVTAKDVDGDILEGVEISLSDNGGSSKIQTVQSTTDEKGEAKFRVTNEIAETVEYTARGMGVTVAQTVVVEFVTVDPDESSIAVGKTQVEANGDETTTITITARDKDAENLKDVVFELTADKENVEIDALNDVSDEDGRARFRVSSETAGRTRFTATALRKADDVEISSKAVVEFIPVAPVSLAGTDVKTDRFTANWELVKGASSYLIDVSTDTTFNSFVNNYSSLDVGFTTDVEISNLEPGTIYYYRVRAQEDDLIGANSETISVETFPEIPISSTPSSRGVTRFSASWEAAPGAQKYFLDVSESENFSEFLPGYENRDVGNSLSFNVTGLFPGKTYFYRVRSMSYTKTSSSSDVIQTSTVEIGKEESEINSSQLRVLANGEQKNTITVVLKDTEGRALESEEITLEAEGSNSEIESIESETNENGQATFAVTNTVAEEVTYKAYIQGTSFEVGSISVEFLDSDGELTLGNNYPNPFRDVTTIPITVPEPMQVRISITNILGATVKEVVDEELNTGYYEVEVDLRDLASGVYFYRLITEDKVDTKKMLMV